MKNKTAFYRLYTQHLRKYYEVSQQDLAKSLEISNTSLSKIEAGKQEMDEKTFKKVIEYFETIDSKFHFSFDMSYIAKTEAFIRQYVQAFVMMTYKKKLFELETFLNEQAICHSFAFFYRELLEILYDTFKEIDCTKRVQHLLDLQYFTNDYYLALLYDLLGISEITMNAEVLKRQNKALKTALFYCRGIREDGLHGMVLYHFILNLKMTNNPEALEYFNECEHILQKAGAYLRLTHSKLNKGNLFTSLRFYSLAQEAYADLELLLNHSDDDSLILRVYESSSWCSLLQGKYEEAIEKARKAKRLGSRFPDIYITFAYGYYKLGDIQSAEHSITRFRHSFSSEPRVSFINSFFTVLERVMENKIVPDYLIERLFKKLPDFRDVDLEMVLYPLLSDHYYSLGSFQEAYLIQKRWNEYLQFTKL